VKPHEGINLIAVNKNDTQENEGIYITLKQAEPEYPISSAVIINLSMLLVMGIWTIYFVL
jgi:hypothetical protein